MSNYRYDSFKALYNSGTNKWDISLEVPSQPLEFPQPDGSILKIDDIKELGFMRCSGHLRRQQLYYVCRTEHGIFLAGNDYAPSTDGPSLGYFYINDQGKANVLENIPFDPIEAAIEDAVRRMR